MSDPAGHPSHGLRARRGCLGLAAGLAVALLVAASGAVLLVRACRRLPIVGSGLRYHDPYSALVPEDEGPALAPDTDDLRRTLLANAEIEEAPPPSGLMPAPRVHPAGTLARLRYEAFFPDGALLERWDVRALVPPLPDAGDPSAERKGLGEDSCPEECRAEHARTGAVHLVRSGRAGMNFEWVLRMPVGRTFELAPRELVTQDVQAAEPRRVEKPARLRVTLVETCRGRLRVGTVTKLDVYPNAIVPIPSGFRTVHWLELGGCPGLESPLDEPASHRGPPPDRGPIAPSTPADGAFAVPRPQPEALAAPTARSRAPGTRAVVARRDPRSGRASLQVDEDWLGRHGQPVDFRLISICRYDAEADKWAPVPPPGRPVSYLLEPGRPDGPGHVPILELPAEAGLFWLRWNESPPHQDRDALVASGLVLCNDVDIGPAPPGRVATCVPSVGWAKAAFVPAPPGDCER